MYYFIQKDFIFATEDKNSISLEFPFLKSRQYTDLITF